MGTSNIAVSHSSYALMRSIPTSGASKDRVGDDASSRGMYFFVSFCLHMCGPSFYCSV